MIGANLYSYRFVLVVTAGLVLRVLWVLVVPVEPISDSAAYDTFARNLVAHGVYGWGADTPSAYWAVGTSAITALVYLLIGDSYIGVVLLNLLTSVLLMVLTARVAQQYFDARVAFWAVVLVAFWPNLIAFTSILSSELYFMMLTLGGLFFWSRRTGPAIMNLILAGAIWGLACYIRPVILLFPVAMAIGTLTQGPRAVLEGAVKAAVCVGMIILIVMPWTLRNEAVIGKAYTVSSNFGTNLWMGNNPESDGGYMPLPAEVRGMGEVEREEYLSAIAKSYIREDPGRFVRTAAWRIVQLHERETIGVVWNEAALERLVGSTGVLLAKMISTGYWFVLLLTALAAIPLMWKERGFGAVFNPIFGGWAYFTAVHAVIVAGDRYHMPSSPFIAILAGVTLAWLASMPWTVRKREIA